MELTPEERQRIYAEEKARVEIQKQLQQEGSTESRPETPVSKTPTNKLKLFGIALLVLLSLLVWYISVPVVIIWYLFKKTSLSKRAKWIATAVTLVIFSVIVGQYLYGNRPPTLSITEPSNDTSLQADSVIIKGKLDPENSVLTVNSVEIKPTFENGYFTYKADLREEKNTFLFTAMNSNEKATAFIGINRIFTPEELASRAEQKKQAEEAQAKKDVAKQVALDAENKAQEEQAKKDLAVKKAWEQSKAGKLCAKNPRWTKNDCEEVADRHYWIGMTYEMLVASLGRKPNRANPSNYGGVTQWQWCYDSITPSCFYDSDGDNRIDSYN